MKNENLSNVTRENEQYLKYSIFKYLFLLKTLEKEDGLIVEEELLRLKKSYILLKLNTKRSILTDRFHSEYIRKIYRNEYNGISIELNGKLKGVARSKRYVRKIGNIKQQSFKSKTQFTKRPIFTKWGVLGLKVSINK